MKTPFFLQFLRVLLFPNENEKKIFEVTREYQASLSKKLKASKVQ